ncbi:hypothetical protein B0H15DRAFT_830270 [Mycena belliarum]|uniref:Uncharacterized protein n=1 Tax=Mycena belliarum TaxID=1033014 RepID=A0AAD6XTK1_9AGAR|nr:hypothetical protein B0H15DRAFT_830270 [Mycena belliae]
MYVATGSLPRVSCLFHRQLSKMQYTDKPVRSRAPRRSVDLEVVEDSEPEREALRQTQRLEKKKRKLVAVHPLELAAMAEKPSVIDISDESVHASPAASSAGLTPSTVSVIEISDSSVDLSEPYDIVNKDVVSLHSSMPNANTTTDDTTNMSILPGDPYVDAASNPFPSLDHSADDEEIIPMLNLAHFAFTNPRIVQHRTFSSTAGSHSSNDTRARAPTKHVAREPSTRSVADFSDTELKKLVKCVSCDIAWTARKSAAQKLVHIRTCAKKNGLTDETVRILIRKEVDAAPIDAGPSKRKGKAPMDEPVTPATLLEDVVRDAAPKRKGKRKETVDALKSVSETRETILERARVLLDVGPFSNEQSFVVQTQALSSTGPTTVPEPTQAFGVSRLGQRQGSKLSLLRKQDSDSEPELPPTTQAFAPSKLGARPASSRWGYESESERESSASDRDVSPARKSNKPFNFAPSPSSVREGRRRRSPKPKQSDEWDDDEAYVHFEPEVNRETAVESIVPTRQTHKKATRQGRGTKSPKSRPKVAEDVAPPKRRRRKKGEDEFDENWELGIKDKIIKDRDLHLRILRYEPISFDIFLKFATNNGEVAGALLKLKLRIFLDKQAINFYGGEPGRGRRR